MLRRRMKFGVVTVILFKLGILNDANNLFRVFGKVIFKALEILLSSEPVYHHIVIDFVIFLNCLLRQECIRHRISANGGGLTRNSFFR